MYIETGSPLDLGVNSPRRRAAEQAIRWLRKFSEVAQIVLTKASRRTTSASLRNLRAQIDKLDHQILELVNKRAGVAAEIGKFKNEHGEDIFSPAREEEVLQNVLHLNEKSYRTWAESTEEMVKKLMGE